MTPAQHETLAAGRWQAFSLVEQLANVGSEVERALNWLDKRNSEYSRLAFLRALELLNLTIADPRHRNRLKELTRLREALLDFFLGDNEFRSSEKSWRSYFYGFAYAAALRRSTAKATASSPQISPALSDDREDGSQSSGGCQ